MNFSEDVDVIFNEATKEVKNHFQSMMKELWQHWSHLGINFEDMKNYVSKLIDIEKELHKDVLTETRQKIDNLYKEVQDLKQELADLGRCFNMETPQLEITEDMLLNDQKTKLEEYIAVYQEKAEAHRQEIKRLSEWHDELTEALGISIPQLPESPLPTQEEVQRFERHLESLQAERNKRTDIFLNTQNAMKDIIEKLQIKPKTKFETFVLSSLSCDFPVTDVNMDRLAELRQDYEERYHKTNNKVLELRETLTKLWECLEEEHIYRDSFLQTHTGCHADTEAAIRAEIERCEKIKLQKLNVFIANIRLKIKEMWDKCMYGPKQRQECRFYYQDFASVDLLTLLEMHLDTVTKHYENNKKIFELLEGRRELWAKMLELEALGSQPGRYQNRGGQLLKEEKERKINNAKLTKVEEQLKEMVRKQEAETGKPLVIQDMGVLECIENEWELHKMERQNKFIARRQAATPTPTMCRSTAALSPLKRSRLAAGMGGSKSAQPKRQLLASSATPVASISSLSALKKSAMSSVKRRVSGRLATKSATSNHVSKTPSGEASQRAKRKLDYVPPADTSSRRKVNCAPKHKRVSRGRRSRGRLSTDPHDSSRVDSTEHHPDPLIETTAITTYSDFKNAVNEKQISRSSMATEKYADCCPPINLASVDESVTPPSLKNKNPTNNMPYTLNHFPSTPQYKTRAPNTAYQATPIPSKRTRTNTPARLTPYKVPNTPSAKTPAPNTPYTRARQNNQENIEPRTPKQNGDMDIFATPAGFKKAVGKNVETANSPRTPLSANKANVVRPPLTPCTPSGLTRAKTSAQITRAKTLPHLI